MNAGCMVTGFAILNLEPQALVRKRFQLTDVVVMTLTSDIDCPRVACIDTSGMYCTGSLEKIVLGRKRPDLRYAGERMD